MIYTVTLNPAVDKTVVIPDFRAGEVNRTAEIRCDAGGKGLNVSKCVSVLGADSTAAMFLGGTAGTFIQSYIEGQEHIIPAIVNIQGETRTNLKIVDPVLHSNTDINEAGPGVSPESFEKLQDLIFSSAHEGDILAMAGSIPTGLLDDSYAKLITSAKGLGMLTLLDSSNRSLVSGIKAIPYLIKPNIDELSSFAGHKLESESAILAECRKLLDTGINKIIVSMGEKGALFISHEMILRGSAPAVDVISTVGAGDSMVAAAAYGESVHMDPKETFRLALAFGSASVKCSGTQAPAKADVDSLYKMIKITEV